MDCDIWFQVETHTTDTVSVKQLVHDLHALEWYTYTEFQSVSR